MARERLARADSEWWTGGGCEVDHGRAGLGSGRDLHELVCEVPQTRDEERLVAECVYPAIAGVGEGHLQEGVSRRRAKQKGVGIEPPYELILCQSGR